MMLGLRDTFEYFRCSACSCLQIVQLPADLPKYYSADYYSFLNVPQGNALIRRVKRLRALHVLDSPNLVGALLQRFYGLPPMLGWIRHAGTRFHQPILDVGCGSGRLLQSLNESGFSNLLGIDPFVDQDIRLQSGVQILKRTLKDLDGPFDLIILNHSFEHMDDPAGALKHVSRLLRDGCTALLRLPLSDGHAWRTYGVDWVQLDAPRHVVLPTAQSLHELAERAGLRIEQTVYDSTAFQFWGSEQYRKGIPLMDERSYALNPAGAGFSKEEIEEWERLAADLNAKKDGDQATFYLRK